MKPLLTYKCSSCKHQYAPSLAEVCPKCGHKYLDQYLDIQIKTKYSSSVDINIPMVKIRSNIDLKRKRRNDE